MQELPCTSHAASDRKERSAQKGRQDSAGSSAAWSAALQFIPGATQLARNSGLYNSLDAIHDGDKQLAL